jgi:hypothetical protein
VGRAETAHGELYDLGAERARWWHRAAYLAGIVLVAAPRLSVSLRRSQRAVD